MPSAMYHSNIKSLPLLARGKVRDNYSVGTDRILMVASDRISAFDVILDDPIPGKGVILTKMALFWFDKLKYVVPNHLTGENPESVVDVSERHLVRDRSMLVHRLRPLPVEAVVRGYLAGSAWKEYTAFGTVCGETVPAGVKRAQKLSSPIFTPATKAEQGEHDENISVSKLKDLVGTVLAEQIESVSLKLYGEAAAFAQTKGLTIADTKFEFGLDSQNRLILMDEILTPDSSRYWPTEGVVEGCDPASFDKQYVRDWLESVVVDGKHWNKTPPPPRLPLEVLARTAEKYREAFERITQ
jgi:phosphoribosylaminoimidazole-succinocarboxamide synthase